MTEEEYLEKCNEKRAELVKKYSLKMKAEFAQEERENYVTRPKKNQIGPVPEGETEFYEVRREKLTERKRVSRLDREEE